LSDEMEEAFEGCLSVPGLRGAVPRYTRLHYEGLDEHGNTISRDADGFHARVVQHEVDHLLGILYPMRIQNFANFGYTSVMFPDLDPNEDD
jgi:peptide deformylase